MFLSPCVPDIRWYRIISSADDSNTPLCRVRLSEAQAASHRCRPGCAVRRRPAPAADPPGCLGGVRRWRPRFPLTGSRVGRGSGCACVPRASSSASATPTGSLAPILYFNCSRLYIQNTYLHIEHRKSGSPALSPPLGPYLPRTISQIYHQSSQPTASRRRLDASGVHHNGGSSRIRLRCESCWADDRRSENFVSAISFTSS